MRKPLSASGRFPGSIPALESHSRISGTRLLAPFAAPPSAAANPDVRAAIPVVTPARVVVRGHLPFRCSLKWVLRKALLQTGALDDLAGAEEGILAEFDRPRGRKWSLVIFRGGEDDGSKRTIVRTWEVSRSVRTLSRRGIPTACPSESGCQSAFFRNCNSGGVRP